MDDPENTTDDAQAASGEVGAEVASGASGDVLPAEGSVADVAGVELEEGSAAAGVDEAAADEQVTDEEVADEEVADEEVADEEVADEEVADEEVADEEVAEEQEGAGTEESVVATVSSGPLEEFVEDDEDVVMDWYILKVQSNRENTICDALRRRVGVAGLEKYFGEIMVPTEDIAEFKNGKKKVVKRKLYPGYIVAHMCINDDTWFLVRETPGIGDFTGSQGKPAPMQRHEVERIVKSVHPEEEEGEQIKTNIPFKLGDMVRIKEGTFENFEGKVEVIDEANGRVTVMISIFGRTTPFEAEHWQIEAI